MVGSPSLRAAFLARQKPLLITVITTNHRNKAGTELLIEDCPLPIWDALGILEEPLRTTLGTPYAWSRDAFESPWAYFRNTTDLRTTFGIPDGCTHTYVHMNVYSLSQTKSDVGRLGSCQ